VPESEGMEVVEAGLSVRQMPFVTSNSQQRQALQGVQ